MYVYENNTSNRTLEENIIFTVKGLAREDGESDNNDIVLEPGETRFIEYLKTQEKWSIQTTVSYRITKFSKSKTIS